jgi:ArsR family transcriptional regulator
VNVSQPTVSHHMAVLHKAGLVEIRKAGLWRWYQRNEGMITSFTKRLKQTL